MQRVLGRSVITDDAASIDVRRDATRDAAEGKGGLIERLPFEEKSLMHVSTKTSIKNRLPAIVCGKLPASHWASG